MFKTPVIKVDQLFISDKPISIESFSNIKLYLIGYPNKSLKLTRSTSDNATGSVNFASEKISEPKICSTEIEFFAHGPFDLAFLGISKRSLVAVKFKMIFSSGVNYDYTAFSTFFDGLSASNINLIDIDPNEKLIKKEEFIKTIPKLTRIKKSWGKFNALKVGNDGEKSRKIKRNEYVDYDDMNDMNDITESNLSNVSEYSNTTKVTSDDLSKNLKIDTAAAKKEVLNEIDDSTCINYEIPLKKLTNEQATSWLYDHEVLNGIK